MTGEAGSRSPEAADRVEVVSLDAARALLRAQRAEEVVDVVLDAVRALGGTPEPVSAGRERTIPIDLTFGTRELLLPAGPPEVLAVLRAAMPAIVEDARVALDRTRRDAHLRETAWTDVLSGVVDRGRFEQIAERSTPEDVLLALRLDGLADLVARVGREGAATAVSGFARFLRRQVHPADTVGRLAEERFGVLLLRTALGDADALRHRLHAAWEGSRASALGLASVVATIDDDRKPTQVLRAAEAALDATAAGERDLVLAR